MKKIAALAAVISLAIFVLFSGSGCFNLGQKVAEKVTEKAVEKAIESEGGEAEVDIGEEGVSIKTDEGEMTIGGADLPDGFPGVVPVYPDMEIITSSKSIDDGKESFFVGGASSDSGKEIFDWYKGELRGWDIEGEFVAESGGESTFTISANDGTYSVSVMIMESEDEVTVMIYVDEL